MNKHGVVLDFGNREIRFPRGQTIKAFTSIEEASLIKTRRAHLTDWLHRIGRALSDDGAHLHRWRKYKTRTM
jgi:hypothetical protein